MKKLMLLAAIACAAFVTQAASINWKTSNVSGAAYIDGATMSGTAYLIDAAILSQSAIATAIAGGDKLTDVIAGKTLDTTSVSSGKFNKTFETDAYEADTTQNFYVVLVNGDKYYASASVATDILGTGNSVAQYKLTSPTKADGAWLSTSAGTTPGGNGDNGPEPTSGLLMLVGGAMLALRRKQK